MSAIEQSRPSLMARTFGHLLGGNRATEAAAVALAVGSKAAKGKSKPDEMADDEDMTSETKADSEDGDAKKGRKAKKAKRAKKAKEPSDDNEDDEDDDDDEDEDDDDEDDDDEDDDDGKEKARKKAAASRNAAFARGRRVENKRCADIFLSPHAAGRPSEAAALAFNSNMSAAAAISALQAMGPAPVAGGALRAAMARVENPKLGAGGKAATPNDARAIQESWDVAFGIKK